METEQLTKEYRMLECVKTEITKEIKDFLELNENEYLTHPNSRFTMKPVLTSFVLTTYVKNWRDPILTT